jgi:NAD(P)-dependent dehydrogenase (short-subunit alcohol dehydrogenase family)
VSQVESASRTFVVTGASRGIGAATARLAARRGYAVASGNRTYAHIVGGKQLGVSDARHVSLRATTNSVKRGRDVR